KNTPLSQKSCIFSPKNPHYPKNHTLSVRKSPFLPKIQHLLFENPPFNPQITHFLLENTPLSLKSCIFSLRIPLLT
ncbi:hypothetical protein CP061683_1677, partial [Chlamydia psittaci 06-1683]